MSLLYAWAVRDGDVTIDFCEADLDGDKDVDAADVSKFLEDFGRNQFFNPCPEL